MVNILIVDKDINYAIRLMNWLNKLDSNLKIVYIAQSEDETLNVINNNDIDIDIIFFFLKINFENEINFYRRIMNKEKYKHSFVILSDSNIIDKNILLYTDTNLKNNIFKNITKINCMLEEKEKNKNRMKIEKELSYLEYDFSLKGTQYLVKAIEYIVNEKLKNNYILEKDIYPKLTDFYHNSIHNIKCNINRANDSMYARCKMEKIRDYFKFNVDEKPKTKLIINTVIDKL